MYSELIFWLRFGKLFSMNTEKVYTLRLFNVISTKNAALDGTKAVLEYKTKLNHKNLEPQASDFGTPSQASAIIPKGTYLFIQKNIELHLDNQGFVQKKEEHLIIDSARSLWLESLWNAIQFKNDIFYIRILEEDGKTVFQTLREITTSNP